jgi:hypothetical protein
MSKNKQLGTIERFTAIFRGYEHAHGEHELFDKPDESGKLKGRAATKVGGASLPHYQVHLEGAGTSLGLVPLMQDDTCWFGAIDIDIQGTPKLNEPIEELEKRIRSLELPLVVCRSKSGGAHLYFLASKPVPAKLLQGKLTQFAAILGYGGAEVFPKQVMRVNDQDRGNWINIAYYGALSKEGTERYALRNGKPILSLEEFVDYAEMMRVSSSALTDVKVKLSTDFEDGPPCLQHLATFGLEQGGRNTALTNIAIYLKKKHPDDWQDMTMKFNYEKVKPSLDQGEVSQILKNVSRKEYFYTCKNPPLVNHCDKKLCGKRQFGINVGGGEGELFPIDNITKCVSKDSVRWYAEHQGDRLELSTDQLLNTSQLQKVFMEKFSTIIITGKQGQWLLRLKELMETSDTVYDPDDASRQGQFENMLENYFSGTPSARNREEIIKGNPFIESGRIYFRSEDLYQYLRNRSFQHTPHEVWMWLKMMDAEAVQMKIKGKKLRIWSLPEPEKFDNKPMSIPNLDEEM